MIDLIVDGVGTLFVLQPIVNWHMFIFLIPRRISFKLII